MDVSNCLFICVCEAVFASLAVSVVILVLCWLLFELDGLQPHNLLDLTSTSKAQREEWRDGGKTV